MVMTEIEQNIAAVRKRIKSAAERSGRSENDVTLVAVTKTKPAEAVNEALSCGITIFGENRVQELLSKLPGIHLRDKQAHIIGHLQTNKVRQIIDKVTMIQSVDSIRLAAEIDRQAKLHDLVMDILIEVNIGGEQSKSGIDPAELDGFIQSLDTFEHIRVRGLMAIPPFFENIENSRAYFRKMHNLFIDMKAKNKDNIHMDILSMGMSADFEIAIEEGSNMVRVGTAIFGKRNIVA